MDVSGLFETRITELVRLSAQHKVKTCMNVSGLLGSVKLKFKTEQTILTRLSAQHKVRTSMDDSGLFESVKLKLKTQ